jgi:signal transduction histidine kinase
MSPFSERLVNRLVVSAVVVGFLIVTALAAAGAWVVQRNLGFTALVAHTHQVQTALSDYRILTERLESARRGYLLSQSRRFRQTYVTTFAALDPALQRIVDLTRDNPRQQDRIPRLRQLLAMQKAAAEASLRPGTRPSLDTDFDLDPGVVAIRETRALTQAMDAEELRLLAQRNDSRLASIENLRTVFLAGAILLVLVAAGSILVIVRYTRDLAASRAELETLNAGLEDAVRDRTADLQRANDEIQRFAYIVSHDLRSPLVNVMGFTSELDAAAKPLGVLLDRAEAEAPAIVTDDARRAVREDLPESIGFIRTSTQKMDRLINAILQLSRQGRRVLAPEPVDMQRLFSAVADSLKHRADELSAEIEVAPGVPGLVSDRLALEQVFSNLVENALKYVSPARAPRVLIRGRTEGLRVVYEVVDNGRGIDPKDHERIFELFRRAGAQDQPGEGIGLAHVRALVYRLGGVISVDSRLDRGATFRVSLPQRLRVEGAA